jgi:shikimate kinase
MENIALIGFMGSGKTTTGKLLAERLGWRFTDTDTLIENAAGRSIPDIFANEGEVAFRNRETAAIQEACRGFCQVIATGGGAILRPDNIVELHGSSLIIWLTARPEVVVARTEKAAQSRPLLVRRDDDLFSHILKMLGERGPLYQSAAHLIIDTSDRSPDAVAVEIQRKWERRHQEGIAT